MKMFCVKFNITAFPFTNKQLVVSHPTLLRLILTTGCHDNLVSESEINLGLSI